jgi:Mrp family chromosome partitioning ATPase
LTWRRNIVLGVMILSLAAGLAYLAFMPATYMATAVLLTDTRRSPDPQDTGRDAPVDSSVVETQIEAIRSQVLALGVVDKLGLAEHPEFNTPKYGLGALVMSFLRPASAQSTDDGGLRRRLALETVADKLGVRRLGRSYVAEISFTSRDPQVAARIVNAIAEGYIVEQLGARQRSQQLSNDWMEKKLRELREEAGRASEAVQAASTGNPGTPAVDAAAAGRSDGKAELEARAQTSKANYENFLARYTQSLQLQTLAVPATEARVLTLANTPDRRSFPRPSLVLLLALIGGGVLGVSGAFAKEAMEGRVRSRSQMRRDLGMRAFLCVPRVRRGLLARGSTPLSLLSGGSEQAIRHVKVAIDENSPGDACVVVGVTSALPREGKTTVAYNLAKACALAGARVLLIDANVRHPSLAREGQSQLPCDEALGLRIASLGILGHFDVKEGPHPSDVLSGAADAMKEIGAAYDYIVIDLPAMRNSAEVSAAAAIVSHFVVVAEWGRTSIDDLAMAFSDTGQVLGRVLGILINKAPPRSSWYGG